MDNIEAKDPVSGVISAAKNPPGRYIGLSHKREDWELSKNEILLMQYIKRFENTPNVTNFSYAALLEVNVRIVRRLIRNLLEKKRIIREGEQVRRGWRWANKYKLNPEVPNDDWMPR